MPYPYDPSQPITETNYPGMPPEDDRANPPTGNPSNPSGITPPSGEGNEGDRRSSLITFFGEVFKVGWEAALHRLGLTNDDLDRILEGQGLSTQQIANLKENEQFRDGIRSGELPSPDLRDALDDIEVLEGRMNEVLDQRGRTDITKLTKERAQDLVDTAGFGRMPELFDATRTAGDLVRTGGRTEETQELFRQGQRRLDEDGYTPSLRRGIDSAQGLVDSGGKHETTAELWRMGRKLVVERGFTPEFRDAFDRLLDVVTEDGSGQTGPGSILHPAFAQLQKIIESEGAEGAGIIPLEDVVGLAEAQAGQRSAQIAEAAQSEAARRGLSPGAVTSGTEVAAESGQLQLNQETQAVAQAMQGSQALRGQAVSSALQNLTKLAEIQRSDPVRGRQADVLGELIRGTVTNIQTGAGLSTNASRLENERLGLGLQGLVGLEGVAANRDATGANLSLGSQSLENQRLGLGLQGVSSLSGIAARREGQAFQTLLGTEGLEQNNRNVATNTILQGNTVQANTGVHLQNQILRSLGMDATTAQSGQQNYLQAIGRHQQLGMGMLGLAGQALGALGGQNSQDAPGWLRSLLPSLINVGGGVLQDRYGRNNNKPERYEPPPTDRTPPPDTAIPDTPAPNVDVGSGGGPPPWMHNMNIWDMMRNSPWAGGMPDTARERVESTIHYPWDRGARDFNPPRHSSGAYYG